MEAVALFPRRSYHKEGYHPANKQSLDAVTSSYATRLSMAWTSDLSHFFFIFSVQTGQYHVPLGSLFRPTQDQWNHS